MEDQKTQISRRSVLKASAGAGLTALIFPSAARMASAQTNKDQVIIGFSQEPTNFNPAILHIEVDEGVHWNMFDPLFGVNQDGTFYPSLAVEVPTVENGGISADGTKWRVRLRDDVRWHDGTPFTAEDVKFTFDLMVDPDFKSMRRTGHELVRNIEVISDHEIAWELESAFAPYPSILSWTHIVPKHAFDGVEDLNIAPFNNAPIGTGPYKWGERFAGNYVRLEANEDYWGEAPSIKTVIFQYVPDLNVLYTQFKTGAIDVIGLQGISPDNFEEAKELGERVVVNAPFAGVESFSLNMGKPQFKEKAVRQALYHAIDKQSIIDVIYFGIHSATESYLPQQSYYHNDSLPKHEFSIEKANMILDDAGWARGSDGVREKDGVRLEFKSATTAGNQNREQMQQFVQQTFQQIGVAMEIKNLPPAVMWGEHYSMSEFDTIVVGNIFVTGSDPDTTNYFKSTSINAQGGSGQNVWQYSNPKVDELLEKGAGSFVPAERKEIYDEIQEIFRGDLAILPMFQAANLRGHKEGLEGYAPNVNLRITPWNVKDWSWT